MDQSRKYGRVTIPTDLDVVAQTIELMKRWGADAIRDCDGTDFPPALQIWMQKYTPPIILPAKITPGPGRIRMKFSKCI